MKKYLYKTIALLISISWVNICTAQESVNATGGTATGNGGTFTYSIGQLVYTTHSSNNGSLAQGVQHPYEILVVSVEATAPQILLSVFPNPTSDVLTLSIEEYNNETWQYQLTDMQGKFINTQPITQAATMISMRELASGAYFLHIMEESKKIKSFKIMKTQ